MATTSTAARARKLPEGSTTIRSAGVARSEKGMADLRAGRGYYKPGRGGYATSPGGDRQRRRIPAHPATSGAKEGGYAKIIGAEYIATLLLIFGLLITGTKKESRAQTLARFTAASLVFALLALVSTGPRSGKVAAAFGGLILIVAALDAATEIETIANALDGGQSSGPPDIGSAGGVGKITGSLQPSSPNIGNATGIGSAS